MLWVILFTVIPLVMVLVYSVFDRQTGRFYAGIPENVLPAGLSENYSDAPSEVALLCTVLCLIIGYPVAMILAGNTFKRRNLLLFLVIAPMWMNFLLRTYAWLSILETNGVLNKLLGLFGLGPVKLLYNQGAVLLGMVYNYLPFMILPIYSVLTKMDGSLLQAASDLGANRAKAFRRVVLPLSLPGVFSGITMVFMPAVTTFVITNLLGGRKYMMIGNIIEKQFLETGNWGFGAALSLVLIIVILVSMLLSDRLQLEKSEGGGLL